MTINTLTPALLRKAADLKERIAKLQNEFNQLLGTTVPVVSQPARKKGGMSAAGRARIVAAQKARWAKIKGTAKPAAAAKPSSKPAKKKRVISAEARARMVAGGKARWAKIRAAKAAKK